MKKTIVGLILVALASTVWAASATLQKTERMRSAVKEERKVCAEEILAERQALVQSLTTIAEVETEGNNIWTQGPSVLNDTIHLLGELRSEQAVPILIKNLWPRPGQEAKIDEAFYSPAAKALGRIGVAGAKAVLGEMRKIPVPAGEAASPDSERMIVCCGVLVDVYSKPVAEAVLEIEIQAEKDTVQKAALQRGLDWLKSRE